MKQQIIILTGHDHGGKTTIAKALSAKLKIPYFKVKRDKYWWDPAVNLTYLTEGITQFIEATGHSVILDRWHCDDYMYSILFNRDISFRKIDELDERFAKMNTLIVYCYKDQEKQLDDEEDKDFINKSMYNRMTDIYREYSTKSKCRSFWLNTSSENLDAQLTAIIEQLNTHENRNI